MHHPLSDSLEAISLYLIEAQWAVAGRPRHALLCMGMWRSGLAVIRAPQAAKHCVLFSAPGVRGKAVPSEGAVMLGLEY